MFNKDFTPPPVRVGMPILWAATPRATLWSAGFVTKVSKGSLDVVLFRPEAHNFGVRVGTRHADDPAFPLLSDKKPGVWRHTPETELLAQLGAAYFNSAAFRARHPILVAVAAYTPPIKGELSPGSVSGLDPDGDGA